MAMGSIAAALVVVVKHPERGRVKIVELPASRRPHEREHRRGDDDQRQRKHEEDDAHATSSPKVRERHDAITTVSELAGIKIAAMSGVRWPVIAKPPPIRL